MGEDAPFLPFPTSTTYGRLRWKCDLRRESFGRRTCARSRRGPSRIAEKLREEDLIRESADLLYRLMVAWTSMGILPTEIFWELRRRELMLGLAEKLPTARE